MEAMKPWITEEMLEKMEERRKWKHQTTDYARKEYKRLNNELRRTTDKAKETWWTEQCNELDELQKQGRYDILYNRIKDLTKKKGKSSTTVKDKNGKLLSNPDDVRERWREYIEELYDKENRPKEEEMGNYTETPSEKDIGPLLLKDEIVNAIKEMKVKKSEGIDEIPAEFIKSLGEKATERLVEICQTVYESGEWPDDFMQTIMVPLEKKANATECGDYMTISLISHASKIMLKILTKRTEAKAEAINFIGEDQLGFRKGKGTREAIAILRTLGERSMQHGKDMYICFVDYEKAFDRVNWCRLMRALERIGIDWKDRRLIKNLYMGQTVMIRIDGINSKPGKIGRAVRQGCPLSPLLFNIYIEEIVREAMEKVTDGVKVGGTLVQAVRFADDQAMVSSTNAGLQRMMDVLNTTSKEYGMKINIKKTKVMRISRTEGAKAKILIDGNSLEQVMEYCYLGSTVTSDGKCHKDIRKRIAMGKTAFNKRSELLRGKLSLQY